MVGSSKDQQPAADVADNQPPGETPESPDPGAAPARKPKPARAKKPKTQEAEAGERTPDPLMMIPEPDPSAPAAGPAVPDQEPPATKVKPVPPAARTTPPPSAKRELFPSGNGRKKSIVIAGVLVFIVIAAMVFTGILHIPATLLPGGNTAQVTAQPAAETEMPTPDITEIPATPDAVAAVVPVTTTEAISLVPGPTQELPENFLVYFEVQRDPISKNVSVLYKGGKGQRGVRDVFVRLTRSDGQVLSGTFKPVEVDSGISLQGTEKVDRVEVIVNYHTGDSYTVVDQVFDYKIRN